MSKHDRLPEARLLAVGFAARCGAWLRALARSLARVIPAFIGLGGIVAIVAIACHACGPTRYVDDRYDRVERVFMQDARTYTLFLRDTGGGILAVVLKPCSYTGKIDLIDDVRAGVPMWAIDHHVAEWGTCDGQKIEIHIHSLHEVEGGGWDHGEDGGKGMNHVIE